MHAVLLAEPEGETRVFLERHLTSDGFQVVGATAAGEALELAERARPALVLLGAGLEDASGLDVCRRLREGEPGRSWDREIPVIVLGETESDAVDRVRAFDRGCDDFLGRPFVYDELLARIRAVLRRRHPAASELLVAGEIVIDRGARSVKVGSERLVLAGKEFELLAKLATAPTRVFTKEELLREVWGYRSLCRTRTVDSHASRLRRKLAALSQTPYVINEWRIGYRLMLPA